MGLFMALSGVIDAGQEEVVAALKEYAGGHSGGLEMVQGSMDEPNVGVITRGGPNTTVIYPDGFFDWDETASHISAHLGRTVFSLHIHDGDLWMFVLFRDGVEIGRFNPIPDYWEELPAEEKARWQGDAALIAAQVPGVSAESVVRYLREWDFEEEDEHKAYADDEFPCGDCWQMCDFMRRVGLAYPVADDGSLLGDTFRFWTKSLRLRG